MIEIPDMLGQLGANASREAIGVQYRKGLDLRTLLQQLCLKQFPYIHAAIPIHQTVNILFGVAWSHTPPFVAESLCKLHQNINISDGQIWFFFLVSMYVCFPLLILRSKMFPTR